MSTKIDFKEPFKKKVDEKETLRCMKTHLKFLTKNAFLLEEEIEQEDYYVEEDGNILDYLTYTKSIVDLHVGTNSTAQSTKLLNAIAKKDEEAIRRRKLRIERKARCGWLLQGIMRLTEKEKKLMIYRYIQRRDFDYIQSKFKNLTTSSYYRLQNHACLHLAAILDLEVYEEFSENTLFSYQNEER